MTKSHEWEIYSNYKINLKNGEFKKRWKEQKLEHNKTTTMVEKFINIQLSQPRHSVAIHRPGAARSVQKRPRGNIP